MSFSLAFDFPQLTYKGWAIQAWTEEFEASIFLKKKLEFLQIFLSFFLLPILLIFEKQLQHGILVRSLIAFNVRKMKPITMN